MEMGTLAIFLAAASLVLLVGLVLTWRKGAVETRLERVGTGGGQSSAAAEADEDLFSEVPSFRLFKMLMPSNQQGRQQIGDRLVQAGLYKRNSYGVYLATKGILMVAPIGLGFFMGSSGMVAPITGLILGAVISVFE